MAKCPICNSNRRSWSLKAIVKRPTYRDGYTDMLPIQVNITDKDPGKYNEPTKIYFMGLLIVGFLLIAFGFFAFSNNNEEDPNDNSGGLGSLACCGSIGLILVATSVFILSDFDKYKQKAEQEHKQKTERYNNRVSKWYRSYYCEMDDIIYDSETGDYCDPSEFQKYLER